MIAGEGERGGQEVRLNRGNFFRIFVCQHKLNAWGESFTSQPHALFPDLLPFHTSRGSALVNLRVIRAFFHRAKHF